ncbi:transposase [Streptomyces sp. NPDC046324]|uniref:transposase n=1 Tax=unclassified Streptomyces TaxID=2593676 RepID=UPI003407A8F7
MKKNERRGFGQLRYVEGSRESTRRRAQAAAPPKEPSWVRCRTHEVDTQRGFGVARSKPRKVDDDLWAVIKPLLPKVERRTGHPGGKRHPDRLVFQGISYVLHTRSA